MQHPPAPRDIPTDPGVYRFRDELGRVVYVGKAQSLRARLSGYFQPGASLHPRARAMVQAAATVDWVVVRNEVEALSLEYDWIKEFDPRFNVRYRDDKSYPYLAITLADPFPRVAVVREARRKGTRYFGPYPHAWAIRDAVDELLRAFPVRSCRDGEFRRAQQARRPCLLGDIGKCAAPCVGRITRDEHHALARDLCSFMSGQAAPLADELDRQMRQAAAEQRYEQAARIRDRVTALRRVMQGNAVALAGQADADAVGLVQDAQQVAVQVLHVRSGRICAERGLVLDKDEDLGPEEYVDRALQALYGPEPAAGYPREVLLSESPGSVAAWQGWLSGQRGSQVQVRVPQRGAKRALVEVAVANAQGLLQAHRLRRSGDLAARSRALRELTDALALPQVPLRIECVDVSTLQGTDTVASLVVFEDALPRRQDYRSFVIKTPQADDLAAIAEVVRRRFAPGSQMRSRSGYQPGLLVVDGGQQQARAARSALLAAGVEGVAVVGLAKRMEEVWLPDAPDPVILPRSSQALYLLQCIRDEAHRAAVRLHRSRRSRRQTASALDGVRGLGPARAKALIQHFGSVDALRSASVDEIAAVPGLGPVLAGAVHAAVHPGLGSPNEPGTS